MKITQGHKVTIIKTYTISRLCKKCDLLSEIKLEYQINYQCFCDNHVQKFENSPATNTKQEVIREMEAA
jgi:hypothetical protein